MAPRRRATCQICNETESKYTCSQCLVSSCSVPCFKNHKEKCVPSSGVRSEITKLETTAGPSTPSDPQEEENVADPKPLRPLTSLNWPYVPEESAYPDPLKRDDPKPLQLPQYEAIATSSQIRKLLAEHPSLKEQLITIDKHRGPDREYALQRALGVTRTDIERQQGPEVQLPEDVVALRALAEAVEVAVRGGKQDALGLDWDNE
ncbi:HIT-type domain-containing protein [Pleurotus pulmonarius]